MAKIQARIEDKAVDAGKLTLVIIVLILTTLIGTLGWTVQRELAHENLPGHAVVTVRLDGLQNAIEDNKQALIRQSSKLDLILQVVGHP